jgi:hypothetical protein
MRTRPIDHHIVIRSWLPLALATTLLCGFAYFGLMHYIRTEANNPQIQLAQDIATSLYGNQTPNANLSGNVDIQKSIAPFVVVYNSNGAPVDGTGKLDDQLPNISPGILTEVERQTERRFTWQPNDTVQVAAVVRYYQNEQHAGYVLAGKNLRETEQLQSKLLIYIASSWASILITTLGMIAFLQSPRYFIATAKSKLTKVLKR